MSKRPLPLVVLSFALTICGCLVDTAIDEKGGADMTVSYKLPKTGKFDDVKKQMESPSVKLLNAELNDQQIATFKLKVDDITKLSTAKFFKNATITTSEDKAKGTKTIVAKLVNKTPAKLPDKVLEFYGNRWEVTATLPGEVVETNATEKDGKKVSWKRKLQEYSTTPEFTMSVTYKVPKS